MDFDVVEKINISKKANKIGAFLYDPEIDGLYLDVPWWFPVQLGVTHGLSRCQVTPMFLKLPFLMKGWTNHEILLRMIELLKLVEKGKILMHASCVDSSLVVGLPNSGKTYQTYKSAAAGGTLISEEYTIIRKLGATEIFKYPLPVPEWHASPYKPVIRTCLSKKTMDHCGLKRTLRENLWLAASTLRAFLFPFMHEAVIWREIPVGGDSALIKKIVYGSTGREVKDWKEFAILCENEFPFMSSEFLQAYALATGFDLIGLQEKQRGFIKQFVESVYPC